MFYGTLVNRLHCRFEDKIDAMKKYLGIDIGGTNVKFGVVNKRGILTDLQKISTDELAPGISN